MTLRCSTPAQEGTYQGSKYLKYQVLCEREELAQLIDGSFLIYLLSGLSDAEPMAPLKFLEEYEQWISALKQGRIPTEAELRRVLAAAFTIEADALWKQEVPGKRFLIKMAKPVIQVQAHYFTYSPLDAVFRPMTLGERAIFWGLQLSFPQIYQDPKTMEFCEVEDTPNLALFQKIKEWVRDQTRATPFLIDGKRINSSIRIGKKCLSWIGHHPQLKEQKIGIYAS